MPLTINKKIATPKPAAKTAQPTKNSDIWDTILSEGSVTGKTGALGHAQKVVQTPTVNEEGEKTFEEAVEEASVDTKTVVKAAAQAKGKAPLQIKEVTHPTMAMVHVLGGLTLNLGNYESAKIQVGITLPCHMDDKDAVYDAATDWVSAKITESADLVKPPKKKEQHL